MKNIPMEVLRSFVTVADVGGFTQAGELLGRSQPAISLQIKRLEELVGKTLLIRSGQQLELTPDGQRLLGYAKRILALNDEAIAQFSPNGVTGRLHLGIPSEYTPHLLPKIVSRFAQTYPNVTLEVTCDLSKHLRANMSKLGIDLILALYDDPASAGSHLIMEDELVWVTSPDHDAHLQSPLPLIVASEGCIYRNRAIQRLKQADLPSRILFTIPDLSGIQAALAEGLGVTVLTKGTVPEGLRILRPSDKFPKLGKVGIGLIGGKEPTEAQERLAEYLKARLASV